MGSPFGIGGDSTSKQDTTSVSDQAQYNKRGNKVAQSQGFLLDLGKTKVDKGGTLAVTFGDTEPIEALSAQFAQTVKDLSAQQSQGLGELGAGLTDSLKDAFNKLTGLAKTTTTGGETDRNQIILWIVLGVFGLVAAIFYLRR